MRTYQEIRRMLSPQMKRYRDRSVREKVELVYLAHRLQNISEACARRGVSRGFYHKWFGRLEGSGFHLNGLKERSRRPLRSPNQISPAVEKRIRFFCKRRRYGCENAVWALQREGHRVSKTTICHVMNHRKPPAKKPRRLRQTHKRRYELPMPGQRFQVDVKFAPHKIGGRQVYVYVAIDECTRWRFARGYFALNQFVSVDFLERLRQASPFPIQAIQTDNGNEFTFRFLGGGPHCVEAWSAHWNIRHDLIPPGEKELNGKVERSNRIDNQYFYWRAPRSSITLFNRSLSQWITMYNADRPHGSLDGMTPLEKLRERITTLDIGMMLQYWQESKIPAEASWLLQPTTEPTPEEALLRQLQLEILLFNDYDPLQRVHDVS